MTRNQVVLEARTWLGAPWRHQGRNRAGIDCVGLLVVVGQALGSFDYDHAGYQRAPERDFLRHFTAGGGVRIPIATMLPGDVLVFRDELYPCHTGFLAERDGARTVIHAYALRRRVMEEPLDGLVLERLVAAYRLPGIG